MQSQKEHWEKVYQTKQADAVSWFQEHATRSLEIIHSIGASPGSHIIDVGGGASTLVDDLLLQGFKDVSVLDLSSSSLNVARKRLGPLGDQVHWLVGDILTVNLPRHAYDIWHDRAVFHFLTDPADRAAYVNQVTKSVKPGGHVIVATFAPDGPEQCSGLPVARYAPEQLHGEFGPAFELLEHASEEHKTPGGTVQHFVYCHCLTPLPR
ncbi:class I SAM-dependent methyltransferase [Crenobacter sp. SG2305]|uniref:class I SAM-dependent methyltransferase n=1 Tax=Crenobacter oryzisoli TaxID=3056844 RepID=UPI0025AAF0DF|nr:class I SAM-dependent methyltransferase [Crenobacter sp. SG2305]MDN0084675.1 class I SAM-dependent methyltransferase [Crenobacter sp. SG2305]